MACEGTISHIEWLSIGEAPTGEWVGAINVPAGAEFLTFLGLSYEGRSEKFSCDAGEGVGYYRYFSIPDTPEIRGKIREWIMKKGISYNPKWWEYENKPGVYPEYEKFIDPYINEFLNSRWY